MGSLEEFEQYTSISIEEIKESTVEKEIFLSKLAEGETDLRILPPPTAWSEWFEARGQKPTPFIELWKHFFQTPSGAYVSFPCPKKTAGLPCRACEVADQLRSSGSEEDREKGWSIKVKRKMLIPVINRDRPEDGPRVWEVSAPGGKPRGKTMFEKITGVMEGRRPKNIVTPGDDGYDIAIKRKGTGRLDTSYTVEAGEQRPLAATPEEAVALINSQPDIRECFKIPGEDFMLEKMAEIEGPPRAALPSGVVEVVNDDEEIPF